jgi:hypothetical protein
MGDTGTTPRTTTSFLCSGRDTSVAALATYMCVRAPGRLTSDEDHREWSWIDARRADDEHTTS